MRLNIFNFITTKSSTGYSIKKDLNESLVDILDDVGENIGLHLEVVIYLGCVIDIVGLDHLSHTVLGM